MNRRLFLSLLGVTPSIPAIAEVAPQSELDKYPQKIKESLAHFWLEYNNTNTHHAVTAEVDKILREARDRKVLDRYLIVCDLSNNSSVVVNNNKLVLDVYVSSHKKIKKWQFTIVSSGLSFEEKKS